MVEYDSDESGGLGRVYVVHTHLIHIYYQRLLTTRIFTHTHTHSHKHAHTHTNINIHTIKLVRTYLYIIEYVLCGGSDDDSGDCSVFVLLLAEHYYFPASDLSHFNSNKRDGETEEGSRERRKKEESCRSR